MNKYNENKRLKKLYLLSFIIFSITSIILVTVSYLTGNKVIKYISWVLVCLSILSACDYISSLNYVKGFEQGRKVKDPTDESNGDWEDLDGYLLNHHQFSVDDIAWGTYGWPAPAGDKFDVYVWERRTDGARYITVEIKNYIWFICYQTIRSIYLVPAGDSGIPHDTSLSNKEFLGIINEFSKNHCNRLFRANGNMTLHVNGKWYDGWERYEYKNN